MAKKAADTEPAPKTKTLHLERISPPGQLTITHVFVEGPAGRVQVPVGTPYEVPAEHEATYLAAALPPGYAWKGRSSGPPATTTTETQSGEGSSGT